MSKLQEDIQNFYIEAEDISDIVKTLVKCKLCLIMDALIFYQQNHKNTGKKSFKEVLDIIQHHLNCK